MGAGVALAFKQRYPDMFKAEKMPVMFVDTWEEAWTWIEKRREEYHAKRKAS